MNARERKKERNTKNRVIENWKTKRQTENKIEYTS